MDPVVGIRLPTTTASLVAGGAFKKLVLPDCQGMRLNFRRGFCHYWSRFDFSHAPYERVPVTEIFHPLSSTRLADCLRDALIQVVRLHPEGPGKANMTRDLVLLAMFAKVHASKAIVVVSNLCLGRAGSVEQT